MHMNSSESSLYRDLKETGEAFKVLSHQDATMLLQSVNRHFPGAWDAYPMNCVFLEDDRQLSIQWHEPEQLQAIIDELAQAWVGEAFVVVEPPGDEPEFRVAFAFNSFADTIRWRL